MAVQVYSGEFWSREWESNADLEEELKNGRLDTPLKQAFADACLAVEGKDAGSKPGTLARVSVSMGSEKSFVLEAFSADGQMARRVETQRCALCAAATYGECHPLNGCEKVLIFEVMGS